MIIDPSTQSPAGRRRGRDRRGSAMVLVVSAVVFMLLIGLSLVTVTGHHRLAAAAAAKVSQTDSAVDQAVAVVNRRIAYDLHAYLTAKVTPSSTDDDAAVKRYLTAPHPNYHPFLAASSPIGAAGSAVTNLTTWPQISDLSDTTTTGWTPASNFINITDPYTNLGTSSVPAVNDLTLSFTSTTDNTTADADGDGFADSRYIRLPISASDGTVWAAAIRVVDNGGKVNLNTAGALNTADATGATPTDVSAYDLLKSCDTSLWSGTSTDAATVLGAYNSSTSKWSLALTNRGLVNTTNSATERLNNWTNFGAYLGRYLGAATGTTNPAKYPFGWDDEVELALRPGRSTRARSTLELALEGAASSPVGALHAYNYDAPSSTQIASDRRRQLTVYNGSYNVKVWLDRNNDATVNTGAGPTDDLVEYRKPMPPYLDAMTLLTVDGLRLATSTAFTALNTTFGPLFSGGAIPSTYSNTFDPTIPDLSLPHYKLNPGWDSANSRVKDSLAKLGLSFATVLNQFSYNYGNAVETGFSLAANLHAYQSSDHLDNTTSVVFSPPTSAGVPYGCKAFFGVKEQPFLREATTLLVYQDRGNTEGDFGGSDDAAINAVDSTSGFDAVNPQSEVVGKYLLVELGNPWPNSIDLTKFYLRLKYKEATNGTGGSADVEKCFPLTGTIAATTGRAIAYSDDFNSIKSNNIYTTRNAPAGTSDASYNPMVSSIGGGGVTRMALASADGFSFTEGEAMTVELLYLPSGTISSGGTLPVNTPYVVVDQLGSFSSNWASPRLSADKSLGSGATDDQKRYIVARSVVRDDRENPLGGMPFYVYSGIRYEKNLDLDAATGDKAGPFSSTNYTKMEATQSVLGETAAGHAEWWDAAANAHDNGTNDPPAVPSVAFTVNLRHGPIVTVGEVGHVLSVAHIYDASFSPTAWRPVTQQLGSALALASATPAGVNDDALGYLHFTYAQARAAKPSINGPMALVDLLDMTAPTDHPMTHGQININTATDQAFAALPYLVETTSPVAGIPSNFKLHSALLAYRHKGEGSATASEAPFGTRSTASGVTTPANTFRYNETTSDACYISPGELYAVRNLASTTGTPGNYDIGILGYDAADNNAAVNAVFTETDSNTVKDDTYERNGLFTRLANCVDTRSDVFTVYVLLKGLKPVSAGSSTYTTAITRRLVYTVDRAAGMVTGNDMTAPGGGLVLTTKSGFNTLGSSLVGQTIYLTLHSPSMDDTAARSYYGIIESVGTNTITLKANTVYRTNLATTTLAASIDASPTTPSAEYYSYVIVPKPKVLMYVQEQLQQ